MNNQHDNKRIIPLIAVVGPTGVGKSAHAIKIAQDFDGEIISADSRQVYRFLDIGTAKPNMAERSLVPHHLIDIISPNQEFSLAQYQELTNKTIADIYSRDKIPIMAGGSGLYVWAVLEGWQIPKVTPDTALRKTFEARAARGESEELYNELKKINPEAAGHIDRRNVRRVIRALEISRKASNNSGQIKIPPPFVILIIGLTASREKLYSLIDNRVDKMVSCGLVEEVKKLIDDGYGQELPSMSGIGYRQIGNHLRGKSTLEEAIQQVKNESHRLARQQYNWFSLKNDKIHWFDIEKNSYAEIKTLIENFLKTQGN